MKYKIFYKKVIFEDLEVEAESFDDAKRKWEDSAECWYSEPEPDLEFIEDENGEQLFYC